jgi:glycosyltransferase involved in cell wall biosynthesis
VPAARPPALDYVSPLPPVRSGIADYSVDLLPHLVERAGPGGLRVLRVPGQPVDPAVAERFGVVSADERAGAGGTARLALYQMGNNRYHREVERMALERPGVLTLHDLVLHHLVSEVHLSERDFAGYRRRLAADHGWIGEEAARPREWGAVVEAMLFELPAHRTLLRRQRGVLVHNRWAAERIAREDPEIRVRVVPMGVPLPPPADRVRGLAFRRRLGIPDDAPVLGSFGFQTPIKRTARAVEALAAPELSGAHLLVVGESPRDRRDGDEPERGELEVLAAELGVADRVHETGFVPWGDFEAGIAACDLCLNLRYPTAGETSASLLRVLAAGRPAVVSDHAQFVELPDEVAVKVPLGDEELPALVARLAALLAAPERLAAMGEEARRHVARRHDPRAAAAAVIEACAAWADAEPPATADTGRPPAVPPPTSRTWSDLSGRLEVDGLEEPWPDGRRRRLTVHLTNTGRTRWLAAWRGPGGIALETSLETPRGDLFARRPWLALPRDLEPGESHAFTLDVRRPPEPARLRLAVRLLGGVDAPALSSPPGRSQIGGSVWEGWLREESLLEESLG